MKNNTKIGVRINWVFFGTSNFSIIVLDELKSFGLIPSLIVTTEDKLKGRKLILTPPEAKIWAKENNISHIQPQNLRNPDVVNMINEYGDNWDVFVVASYGKIIPQNILDIPKHKTLNIHPSLLPKLRGPSPIQNAILKENETGVTIMRLDAEMDHGPIVTQEKIDIDWPPYYQDLEKISGEIGGQLLIKILPDWINGKIKEKEQNHHQVTYCKKVEKADAELNFSDKPELNLRKIRAYHLWPGAYFFDNQKRMVVKKARMEDDKLIIERVVPEGKKEMNYEDYLRGRK